MGETLTTWSPSCNGSVRVEMSGHRTTSDSGALLLREALDNSGVIEALECNLVDRRHPLRIRHSLASQLRTLVMQRAMGWIDLSDTDTLRRDPLWQLACSDARGMTPLAQDRPSQATLSRLLACLGRNDNIDAVHEGLLRLVVWRLTSLKNGERPKQLTLDIDGLPIEVHGHQGGSTYHGLYGARNEVSLLLSLYAYQILHGLRCLLERQTRQGWSLSRMREQVLKVAATLRLHARRVTVHLGAAADKWWPTLLKGCRD